MADGLGCECAARSEGECSCVGVDWTSQKEIDLRAEVEALKANLDRHMEVIVRGNAANEALQKELAALKQSSEPVAYKSASIVEPIRPTRKFFDLPANTALYSAPQPQASEPAAWCPSYGQLDSLDGYHDLPAGSLLYTHPAPSDLDAWVSVNERLPNHRNPCLVYSQHDEDGAVIKQSHLNPAMTKFYVEYAGDCPLETITHWMPLPAAPSIAAAMDGGK